MVRTFKCKCCRRILPANPRCKNQEYCGAPVCQRERKRRWQAQKMNSDPEYRDNQQEAYDNWRQRNPDYWQRRRKEKQRQAALPGKKVQADELNGHVKVRLIARNSREFRGISVGAHKCQNGRVKGGNHRSFNRIKSPPKGLDRFFLYPRLS